MIPLAKHTAQVQADDTRIDPIEISIGLDESWSPRVQGDVVLPADTAAGLPEIVTVWLRASFGSEMSVAAVTEWAGGSIAAITARVGGSISALTSLHTRPWNPFEKTHPISALTAQYGGSISAITAAHGGSISAITASIRQAGGSYNPPASQVLEYVLYRRSITRDEHTGEARVELASADIMLHDYRRMSATEYTSAHTSLRDLVGFVLDFVGGTLNPGGDIAILAGAVWWPGHTAWDYLQPNLEAAGWQLFAEPDGTFTLGPRVAVASPIVLDRDSNLIEWSETVEPEHDAAIVEYTGTSPAGFDIYAPPGSKRPLLLTHATVKPASGAASEIVVRASQRARTARARAVSLYALRPGAQITARPTEDAPRAASVEAVSFRWPAATMDVSMRDLVTL